MSWWHDLVCLRVTVPAHQPVDVSQLELGDFAAAQPHVQEAVHNGETPFREWQRGSERVEQAFDLTKLECYGRVAKPQ
jgi:hypothetical protein